MSLNFLGLSINRIIQYAFIFAPASFTQHGHCESHAWCGVYQWFVSLWSAFPSHGSITMCLPVLLSVAGHLLLSRVVDSHKQSSSEHAWKVFLSGHMLSSLLDKYLGVQWLGHMLSKRMCNFLGNWQAVFHSSSTIWHAHRSSMRLPVVPMLKHPWYLQSLYFNSSWTRGLSWHLLVI